MYYFDIITIFPELFNSFFETSILKRAQLKNKAIFSIHNLRDYTSDRYRTVDDAPYGGGAGMVMKPDPIFNALDALKSKYRKNKTKIVLLSPQGTIFKQSIAVNFAKNYNHLIFICGRYEGIDERVKAVIDQELSIGDYVLSGGEVPALVVIETVVRLIPGVLGNKESYENDSFYKKFLDYPQYTRPDQYKGFHVPDVLLSGNHNKIKEWRKKQALLNTYNKRPDILSDREKKFIQDNYILKSRSKKR